MRSVLGDLSPAKFVRDYWQKRPLLVRQAIPGFSGIVDRDALLALATRGDATSRLVIRHPRRWERHDGPFGGLDASMLPAKKWTLLVHGVESLVPGGWEILRRFAFLPAARIDDLMVSYAADGGGVGPHDDRYDVFLLQGPGRRRWRIMHGGDRSVDPNAKIRVLSNFVTDEEWLLEPGDMLYLPPGVAHWGIAEGPCFTYSIGFLAPSHRVLVESFLGYLAHMLDIDADVLLRDTVDKPARQPLVLPDAMLDEVGKVLGTIRWDARTREDFLGRFLTSPKSQTAFSPPKRPLDGKKRGRLTLALPSRGLVRGQKIFLNGESYPASRAFLRVFEELVATRSIAWPPTIDSPLYSEWHAAGWCLLSR
jgi:50S ribosomal protein L16 3-hydroxylase